MVEISKGKTRLKRWKEKSNEAQLGYTPKNGFIFWLEYVFFRCFLLVVGIFKFTNRYELINPENLLSVIRLVEDGHSVVGVPHHSSSADTFMLQAVLFQNRQKLPRVDVKKLIESLVFFIGLRFFEKHRFMRVFILATDRIKVFPHTLFDGSEEAQERAVLINTKALEAFRKLKKEGRFFILFAEGTRNPKGFLQKAPRGARAFLQGDYLVPIALVGFDRYLPVGCFFLRFWRPLKVIVGKPISINEFKQEALRVASEFKLRGADLEIHLIMKKVAALYQEHGAPEYLGYYARSIREILWDEGLLPEAA